MGVGVRRIQNQAIVLALDLKMARSSNLREGRGMVLRVSNNVFCRCKRVSNN